MTALYYQALQDDERIALLTGDKARAEADRTLASRVKTAFERELWDPARRLFRDGKPNRSAIAPNQWLPADKPIETFSTQVNALAVACGLATGARAKGVMTRVIERPDMNCQPYFMHFVFDALARSGLYDRYALGQIRRWKVLPDTQSFFEMWNTGDRSHAWNATPLFQMSSRILGVTPIEPGFRKFRIAPIPCGLSRAKGVVPSPLGDIQVAWHQVDGALEISFLVPKHAVALVGGSEFASGRHEITIPAGSVNMP
jgi:hypothetical protein